MACIPEGTRVGVGTASLLGGLAGGTLFWFATAALESWAGLGAFSERLLCPAPHNYAQRGLAAALFALAVRLALVRRWRETSRETSGAAREGGPRTAAASARNAARRAPDGDARKATDELLRQLARAVEASSSAVVITDRHGCITYVNPKFTEVTGFTAEEVLGRNPRLLKSGEMPPEAYSSMWETIAGGGEWRGEFHNRRKDGSQYWEFASISPVVDEAGEITHFVAVKEDITARKLAERALRESEEKYRQLFSRQFDAAIVVDTEAQRLVEANDAFLHLLGWSQEELATLTLGDLWAPEVTPPTPLSAATRSEIWCRRRDGSTFPVELATGTFSWRGRTLACYILRDITDRLLRERSLETLSTTDGLTGLVNWRNFQERLEGEWRRAIRSRSSVAMVLADLDFFKAYNDSCGHLAGDECLRRVAHALAAVARRTADVVARWGGEEFAVLLPGTDLKGAAAVAEAMRLAIQDLAVAHPASPVAAVVTASFGVAAIVPREGTEKEHLVAATDAALYAAKGEGRNRVCRSAAEVPPHPAAVGAPSVPLPDV